MRELIRRPVLRYGLILGVAEILYGIFFRVAGFQSASAWGWVFYLMLPFAVWATVRARHGGSAASGYLRVVGRGSLAVLIGAAIYCVQVWLYNRFIDDSLLVDVRAAQLERLAARGLGADELASATRLVEGFTQPAAFSLVVWAQLSLTGLALALVLGVIARRV